MLVNYNAEIIKVLNFTMKSSSMITPRDQTSTYSSQIDTCTVIMRKTLFSDRLN